MCFFCSGFRVNDIAEQPLQGVTLNVFYTNTCFPPDPNGNPCLSTARRNAFVAVLIGSVESTSVGRECPAECLRRARRSRHFSELQSSCFVFAGEQEQETPHRESIFIMAPL